MRKIGVKGTATAIIATAAIALVIFALSNAIISESSGNSFLTMQAARENAIKTDNVIRLLDKATSDGYYDVLNPACNPNSTAKVQEYFNSIAGNMGCTFVDASGNTSNPSFNQGQLTAQGYVQCTTGINGVMVKETRQFSFQKEALSSGSPPSCSVRDGISGCTEQPSYSCT
ncbi:MAG: hypothetical protein AABW99_00455 [archaeon]